MKAVSAIVIVAIVFASMNYTALAAVDFSSTHKSAPSGTLLIPIAPRIDTSVPGNDSGSGTVESALTEGGKGNVEKLMPAPETISAEQGNFEEAVADSEVGEDTTLKGTVQIVADDTEYDQQKNTFLGTGNAVVSIGGEDSRLEADTILYDQNNQVIDARGNVRIYRDGQLTTGSAFRFKVTSDEYMITRPDTEINGTTVIARTGYGSKHGLAFQNGTLQL